MLSSEGRCTHKAVSVLLRITQKCHFKGLHPTLPAVQVEAFPNVIPGQGTGGIPEKGQVCLKTQRWLWLELFMGQ